MKERERERMGGSGGRGPSLSKGRERRIVVENECCVWWEEPKEGWEEQEEEQEEGGEEGEEGEENCEKK